MNLLKYFKYRNTVGKLCGRWTCEKCMAQAVCKYISDRNNYSPATRVFLAVRGKPYESKYRLLREKNNAPR